MAGGKWWKSTWGSLSAGLRRGCQGYRGAGVPRARQGDWAFWGEGRLLAVAPQQFWGLLAQGSRYRGRGTTLGDETHPGECHSPCVSILFHNPVEKRVGVRPCLPGGLLPTPRTCTKSQGRNMPGSLAPNCSFPGRESPEEQHWGQNGLREHSMGGCVQAGRAAEGSCVEQSKASLFATAVLFSASGIGAGLLGERRPFFAGAACVHPAYL